MGGLAGGSDEHDAATGKLPLDFRADEFEAYAYVERVGVQLAKARFTVWVDVHRVFGRSDEGRAACAAPAASRDSVASWRRCCFRLSPCTVAEVVTVADVARRPRGIMDADVLHAASLQTMLTEIVVCYNARAPRSSPTSFMIVLYVG